MTKDADPMQRIHALLVLALLLLVVIPSHGQLVDQHGSDLTFDVATWNIENFPRAPQTVNALSLMLNDMEIELIGCQEITDDDALEQVAANAGGWRTVIGDDYYGLRHAVIYDAHKVSVGASFEIFVGNSQPFPRAPLVVPVTMVEAEDTLRFNFMVFHLKAGRNDSDSRERRAEAIDSLKAYVDRQMTAGNGRWMLVGDWNDDLDDPDNYNIFTPMLEDQNYHFLTLPLVESGSVGTWIPAGYFYDHILVTEELYQDYVVRGETEVLRLDSEYSQYEDFISDHRPTASYFPTEALLNVVENTSDLPSNTALTVWPVPANAMVNIGYDLPADAGGMVQVYDLLGRELAVWQLDGLRGKLSWNAFEQPTGIYFVKLSTAGETRVERAVIVK